MSTREESKAVAVSEDVFRRLLAAYPAAHRAEFGEPMTQLFRDQCRDAWRSSRGWGLTWLWLRVLPDVAGTSFLEHLETIKQRKYMFNRIGGGYRAARFFTVFAAVFLLVVITATIVTFLMPEVFQGTARVVVKKTQDSVNAVPKNAQPATAGYDPYWIQTEFEVMQSEAVLGRVVDHMNLTERWGKKFQGGERIAKPEACKILRNSLDIRPVRNTSLIEIRAFSDKPGEAAELANSVAEEYRNFRAEKYSNSIKESTAILREQLDRTDRESADLGSNLDRLRAELKIVDTDPQSTSPAPTFSAAAIQQLNADAVRADSERIKLETQLIELKSLSGERLRGAIQTVFAPDTLLDSLLMELNTAQRNLLNIQKARTQDHPDYVTAKSQVEAINKDIELRLGDMLLGFETRLNSIKAWHENLTNQIAHVCQTDSDNAANIRQYWELKRNVVVLQQYRSLLRSKLASEETDRRLENETPVEIVDRATPTLSPVRPNKPLNFVIGICLGTVLGLIAGAGVAGISFLSQQHAPPKTA